MRNEGGWNSRRQNESMTGRKKKKVERKKEIALPVDERVNASVDPGV